MGGMGRGYVGTGIKGGPKSLGTGGYNIPPSKGGKHGTGAYSGINFSVFLEPTARAFVWTFGTGRARTMRRPVLGVGGIRGITGTPLGRPVEDALGVSRRYLVASY